MIGALLLESVQHEWHQDMLIKHYMYCYYKPGPPRFAWSTILVISPIHLPKKYSKKCSDLL